MHTEKHLYHHYDNKPDSSSALVVIGRGIKESISRLLTTLLYKSDPNKNSKIAGKYISNSENIMKFPLLVSDGIDQSVVSKFCAYLQKEKAENFRTFFYNKDLRLGYANSNLAKEFKSNFYESAEENFDGEILSEAKYPKYHPEYSNTDDSGKMKERHFSNKQNLDIAKHISQQRQFERKLDLDERKFSQQVKDNRLSTKQRASEHTARMNHEKNKLDHDMNKFAHQIKQDSLRYDLDREKFDHSKEIDRLRLEKEQRFRQDQLSRDDFGLNSSLNRSPFEDKLSLGYKELMPIAPTMINIVAKDAIKDKRMYQILGIRYLPHRIPFAEMKVAFKYGLLNNKLIFRVIKFLSGDLTLRDLSMGTDRNALNSMLMQVTLSKKWNEGLKESSQAVSMIITREQFDDICNNIVDLRSPNKFKMFEKDIGLLDLFILDKNAKKITRINAADNYVEVEHDLSDIINANEKDIVIQARIDASRMRGDV